MRSDNIEALGLAELPPLARTTLQPVLPSTQPVPQWAAPWDSKLGGAPWRPRGAGWPTGTSGRPLGFLAQVNLGHVEAWRRAQGQPRIVDGLLPTFGLLQFYVPLVEFDWGDDPVVKYWPDVAEDPTAADEPVLAVASAASGHVQWAAEAKEPLCCELTDQERALGRHWGTLASTYSGGEATPLVQPDFAIRLEPMPLPVLRGGIQLGGHLAFTRQDPGEHGTEEVLLFQLDGGAEAVYLGDAGVMSFFIDPEALAARDFSRVRMSWDCARPPRGRTAWPSPGRDVLPG